MLLRPRYYAFAALVVLIGVLAACGDEAEPTATATATVAPAPTATATSAPVPTTAPAEPAATEEPAADESMDEEMDESMEEATDTDIKDFTLQDITVKKGSTVKWTNRDSVPHYLRKA